MTRGAEVAEFNIVAAAEDDVNAVGGALDTQDKAELFGFGFGAVDPGEAGEGDIIAFNMDGEGGVAGTPDPVAFGGTHLGGDFNSGAGVESVEGAVTDGESVFF